MTLSSKKIIHTHTPSCIIVASNNIHKITEIQQLFPNYTIISVGKLLPTFNPEETGNSFMENSVIKAKSLWYALQNKDIKEKVKQYGTPIILSDDSGIMVDALHGKPGIYSARFGNVEGKEPLNSFEKNTLLLSLIKDIPRGQKRSARYICCMTLYINENRFFNAQETWEGEISSKISRANNGFGYDPIFYIPEFGCTVADLSSEQKNIYSHRAKAARVLMTILQYNV